MKVKNLLKSLLVAAGLLVGGNVWADDWSTVWTADFSSAPSGMTYSVASGSTDISSGVLFYHQGGGSGNRSLTTSFTADAFKVSTNWQMEFDWGASSANQNSSSVAFGTNNGTAFTLTWASYATAVTITDAANTELTTTLPIDGYNKATMTNLSHFTITGDTGNGIYLTVTNGGTTYVNNVLVSSTYGYPATFSGSLGRAVSHMALDNIVFKIPAVAGFVPAPTSTLTGADGVNRKFTLSCTDPSATIYYSETQLAADDAGWIEYTSEVTTSAATVYAVAKKGSDASDVYSFATGAGTEISLNAPTIAVSNMVANGDVYNAVFNASYNVSGVEFEPAATLSASFTPKGGTAAAVTLPYTVTENGTLTISASADGFASSETTINVYASYVKGWQSANFSTLAADDVASTLGDVWVKQEGTGRWASWKDQTYTYYSEGSSNNVTANDRLRMRGVIALNLGYGLGRNITGTEAINVLSTGEGDIVAFQMYNGYGNHEVAEASYYSYSLNAGTAPSVGTNSGNLLVQATVYAPIKFETMSIVGDFSPNGWEPSQGIAMTRDASDPAIWTAVVDDFQVTSAKYNYEYKAVANGNWSEYVLPASDNQNYNFDYDGARDGIYKLTFTADTKTNTVSLAIEKQPTATVYFINTKDWDEADVKIWVWDANNGNYNYTGGTWPGAAMTKTTETVDGHDVYTWSTYELNPTPTNLIVSKNGDDTERTGDQPFVNGATYKADGSMSITTTVSSAGWATLYTDKALDFSAVSGLTAYTAKYANGQVVLTEVDDVPANTGVVLKGNAGDYDILVAASSSTDKGDLMGSTTDATAYNAYSGATLYMLNIVSGKAQFVPVTGGSIAAGKAFLKVGGAARSINVVFGDETTGIANVNAYANDNLVYDMQGRRVAQPTKGLYIVNGKKVIIK